ncbi:polysaccharide lyase family 7 protein [Flavobacterium sp. NG2]|uniref:polysaccharide lyase family 7 protein n=1 Tax=Flavobacterium sp. NG2 TaxID=3097547 RepID=UPI002A82E35D|nr:polysaccharide lyase family 7 protein [Flavobacterium sp. NG2]WPR72584.1 polysaccharide lyase family 7 protein [Flavobacterium sp. NG2]
MISLQSVKMTICCAALAATFSCTSDSEVSSAVESSEVLTESTTSLTAKTYVAPGSSSTFSAALAKCKLQTDYLTSDVTDLSSYASYFFYLSSGKMVLYNNGGASTRTELRRTDNFNKTSVRKMTISANLVSQPTGEVTLAQLHNQNATLPVLRVSVTGNTIYYKVNKEPVKGTSLTNNGAFTTTLPSSKLLQITLELTGNKYISATVNGEKRTFYIEDAWGSAFDNAYYFKTGVYCQSDGTAKLTYNSLSWE